MNSLQKKFECFDSAVVPFNEGDSVRRSFSRFNDLSVI